MPRLAHVSQSNRIRPIASRQNPIVQEFRELARKRKPTETRMLIDGWHLLLEARQAGVSIERVAFTRDLLETTHIALVANELAESGVEVFEASSTVMEALSPVRTPMGVVAIARREVAALDMAFKGAPQLMLAALDIQDPGNLGAMIRAADAAGATGIVACGASADPFGWKALRGAMGSAFRLPIARADLETMMRVARAARVRLVAAVPRFGQPLFETDLRAPTAFLLGTEGAGLPLGLLQQMDETVTIPMRPPVESLNVAVAAALLFYEAMRQRSRL
ncbi:MAG TPA: RNA methyltransferase [Vicinamibacterales bacterium]